jgi:hypothetical protein
MHTFRDRDCDRDHEQAQLSEIEAHALIEHRLEETLQSMSKQWDTYCVPLRPLGTSGTYYAVAVREAKAIVQDQVLVSCARDA